MSVCVLMRVFEAHPARYDEAMERLTLGRITRLKRAVASAAGGPGKRVLELGCGTGALATMLARRGASVLAIDSSEAMLDAARKRVARLRSAGSIELRRMSLMEIDSLPSRSFDAVVATLVLSELSDQEAEYVLRQSHRLLTPRGRLLVADETVPTPLWSRACSAVVRLPVALLTYLVVQARSLPVGWARRILYFCIELPLMLLTFCLVYPRPRSSRTVDRLVCDAGFTTTGIRSYLGGTLVLVRAEAR